MQISSTSSAAMQMPNMQATGSSGSGGSGTQATANGLLGQGQEATPLNDMIETGKQLSAELMMTVLFGKDKDDDDKNNGAMAMMLMAAGAQGNSYNATGNVINGNSGMGQNLNVTA